VSGLAFVVVALSAIAHVHWNLLAKRSGGDLRFFAKLQLLGACMLLPFGLVGSYFRPPTPVALAMVGLSGLCYLSYYTCLGRAYRSGALSIAYPISRGVAPAAAALVGVCVLGERLRQAGWAGVGLVALGILAVGYAETPHSRVRLDLRTILWAIATGLFSAGYMVFDKVGVQNADPSLYLSLCYVVGGTLQFLLFRHDSKPSDGARLGRVLAAAASCTIAYLAVLWVMRYEPVSMVAPVRSLAVVFSVLVGSRLLGEAGGALRYLGEATILCGILLVSLRG